jgi:hypothetical protein
MPYDDEFAPGGKPFDKLIGPPDPISSALGHIVLVFGKLDAYVSATLLRMLDGDEAWGRLLTAALSWEEKLALLDERVRLLAPTGAFHAGARDPVARVAELRAECRFMAQIVAMLFDPALAAGTLARIIRLHHPFSRYGAKQRRQSAWEEAGVLFEWIYRLVALTEELQAFFDGPGPDTP